MDIVAAEGAQLMREENAFATPDRLRSQPLRNTDEIITFQACVAALDVWPLDVPIDGWSLRLITEHCEFRGQTAYLQRLADF